MATTSYGIDSAYSRLFPAKETDNKWKKYIGTMPSITGEQQAVNTPLSNYLAEALAGIGNQQTFADWSQTNVPDMFGGALGGQLQSAFSEALSGAVPNMFGGELGSEAMAGYKQAMSGIAPNMFGGELGSQAKSAYAEALKGIPVDYNPSGANFLQNIIPAIKESYVGTGAITGTEVGDRINRESSVMQESIANIKAGLYNEAKNRQVTAAMNYQTAYQSGQEQAKQRQLVAAGNYQQAYQNAVQYAKDRQLSGATSYQQYALELTKLGYDNYVRQNPAASEILQAALSYLNIPLMGVYQKPVTQ